ncbi:hypothetical protein AOC36_01130 [Erysipelothrix larvae]|uniref:Aspartyl/glutamyl-tRNA(Asn/Gln) amidotransferase subunit C n=1 Tax=Erysipelothrix larvae TaxID=1514105 RepID=A0A0X8GYA1_9FIRM|nr:Asp-tRNA(Asn)/Glu-tRNA(Gln) amidotransferase subunit GatC [Erysipelothrix larvae]AMC92645.1 hypothetical protein AOC36_01130 [Erysipelothrix larvae]
MKRFTNEQIDSLCEDLMLTISDEERAFILKESEIFMAQLEAIQDVDTDNVAMMSYPFEVETNWLREDVVTHVLSQEVMFENAPKTQGDYIEIVKVIEK